MESRRLPNKGITRGEERQPMSIKKPPNIDNIILRAVDRKRINAGQALFHIRV